MFVAWLVTGRAAIYQCIGIEEISGRKSITMHTSQKWSLQSVQAEYGQFVRDDFDKEPSPSFKSMPLLLWDKLPPHSGIFPRPPVGAISQDVVGHDIVVPECSNDGNQEIINILFFPKNFYKLVN